jgi:hypothetical protein
VFKSLRFEKHDFCPSRRWSFDTRSVTVATHHPGHICYGSSTAQRKLPHGTANVEQEHKLLDYVLTSRPSCGTLDMQDTNRIYLTESGIGGEHLEDASHVIDHTDSDQSVIEEWDPTILLETPYNIIMIL